MRLLTWNDRDEITLTGDLKDREIPPYAILSHTWGADSDEVRFADMQQGRAGQKIGYQKIQFCGERARRDQIKHFWIDTCCINKADSTELSEAINSMYRWYRDAEKCYVYLSDVSANQSGDNGNDNSTWQSSLWSSRWFTRGWTLQELLAPKVVEFFSRDGVLLGTKETLAEQISKATALPMAALYGAPPAHFTISERWQWARERQTSRTEDRAYCLFGIFDVFLPLIYGEGDHAFLRLEKAVNERSALDVHAYMGDNRTTESVDPYPRSNVRSRASGDNGYIERASNRHEIDRSEADSVRGRKRTIQESQNNDEDKYDSLLKSLVFNRIDFRVNNVEKAILSTCDWLLRHPHFQSWYNSSASDPNNGFLWIKGKPGCGKSTLMKVALEWVRKKNTRNRVRQTIIPYFFNARGSTSLEKSALGLYRTVVYRLLSTYGSLRPLFMNKFALKDPGSSGEEWTTEELQDFLYDSVESCESFKLCLFIDALDEAEYENDVRDMISFLKELSDRASAASSLCQIQTCLSSRHYPHITIDRGLSLVVEDQLEHDQDIKTYINKKLSFPDSPDKDILQADILNKSARIFLWVVLVVRILNPLNDQGKSLSTMQAHLEKIPAGLDELFRDILLRSSDDTETTALFFQWFIFSMRPLEPAELFVAIEYSRTPAGSDWNSPHAIDSPPSDRHRLARYLVDCSHGLVEVIEVTPGQPHVVQFIHETVREFLIKDNGLVSIVPTLKANLIGISHETLRTACFRCVSTTDIPDDFRHYCVDAHKNNDSLEEFKRRMRQRIPFLDYAVLYLLKHAEQAQKYNVSQQSFVKTQLNAGGALLNSYRLWWNVLQRYKSQKVGPNTTLLYLFVQQECFSLIPILPDLSDNVNNTPKNCHTALELVSEAGHLQEVQLLLEAGAEVNAQGKKRGGALHIASLRGHVEVVHMLLNAGADITLQGGRHDSALQAASTGGNEKIVCALMEAGASANISGRYYSSALHAASMEGHEKIVLMLLDAGADVNRYRQSHGNALVVASTKGHEKIVRILLDAGADVNQLEGPYESALVAASTEGHEKIVRMLLEAGTDVNQRGYRYHSALNAASACGHEKIVRILLEAGADLSRPGGQYTDALYIASRCGQETVVRLLIEMGADVNARGEFRSSPLLAARGNGHEKIVQILKQAGARGPD